MTEDTDEVEALCVFLPCFTESSPVRSLKPPRLIRSVQREEWSAVDEVELGLLETVSQFCSDC